MCYLRVWQLVTPRREGSCGPFENLTVEVTIRAIQSSSKSIDISRLDCQGGKKLWEHYNPRPLVERWIYKASVKYNPNERERVCDA
jgi:hypothetical protein